MNTRPEPARDPVLQVAAGLAARGHYQAAVAVLATALEPAAERSLLEGQIAAQQGRFEEAIHAFESIAADAPQHALAARAATRARRSLRHPWLARNARPVAAISLGVALFAGAGAFTLWAGKDRESMVAVSPPPAQPASAAAGTAGTTVAAQLALPASAPYLSIAKPGVTARRLDAATLLEFELGLFDSGRAVMRASQKDKLAAAGRAIREGSSQPLQITVVGYTDPEPLRAGARFADNTALAYARALAVADYLHRQCGLPSENIAVRAGKPVATSARIVDARDRARERTVALHVAVGHAPETGR